MGDHLTLFLTLYLALNLTRTLTLTLLLTLSLTLNLTLTLFLTLNVTVIGLGGLPRFCRTEAGCSGFHRFFKLSIPVTPIRQTAVNKYIFMLNTAISDNGL